MTNSAGGVGHRVLRTLGVAGLIVLAVLSGAVTYVVLIVVGR